MCPDVEFIFPFKNGVVDLRTREFRPAAYSEMILHTTGKDFTPATPEAKKRVMDELCEIYADDDQVMVKLITMSACLRGKNIFQSFNVEVGSGGNAKGTMQKFMIRAFGKLAGSLDKLAVQARQTDVGQARSDLANVAYARVIFISEPDAALPLYIATVKQMSGNDDILCRALYKDTFTIKEGLAPIYMVCNEPPPMDESAVKKAHKKSMARRLLFVVNPFEFDGGDEPYCKKPNATVDKFFKTKEATDALLEILMSVYFNFTIYFEEQDVNMIKDVEKVKFPSGHKITYPAYWDEQMAAYKNAGDNVV
eukprot:SAG22_NODE_5930_length_928_cov_3.826680_1_plen_308_part_11